MHEDEERRRAASGRQPRHRIFFMIVPFADHYRPLVDACRRVVEDRWGVQLVVASDRQDDHRLLEQCRAAHEPGACLPGGDHRGQPERHVRARCRVHRSAQWPFALLRESGAKPVLPADLRALLYIDYDLADAGLDDHLHQELRKNSQIRALIDDGNRARYVSPAQLRQQLPFRLDPTVIERLAAKFPTIEDWEVAQPSQVAAVLSKEDQDLAGPIIERIRRHRLP